MYFIDKEKDLIGKEIAFTHFARFADAMTIVTKDKGIFVFNKEDEEEGIYVYRASTARRYILNEEYLRKQLNSLGIITNQEIQEYEDECKRKWENEEKLMKQQQQKNEYEQYLRLKEKYEGL